MPSTPLPVADRGRFVLMLGDIHCGFVSAEGGDISAPVIREPAGAFVRKTLGHPAPEPIVLSFDLSLDKEVYDWIGEFWKGVATAKSGSVISLDQNHKAVSELVFDKAVITATTVPAMDASSRTPCQLSIRLNPAATRRRPASGPVQGPAPPSRKVWLPSNFRLEIGGLETGRVSKIEPLTVAATEGRAIDFPDVRVLLSEVGAQAWFRWHDEFVVKGKNDESNEMSGELDFLTPDQKTRLGRLTLRGLGIHRLAREPVHDRVAEQVVSRLVAGLYCERMELTVP